VYCDIDQQGDVQSKIDSIHRYIHVLCTISIHLSSSNANPQRQKKAEDIRRIFQCRWTRNLHGECAASLGDEVALKSSPQTSSIVAWSK
jgi:hypothetical protein